MQTIIGLGQAGCNLADKFNQHPEYKIYKIDVGLKDKGCFNLSLQNTPEEYEEKCPVLKIRAFLKSIEGEVLFITSCGNVSGASLRILEQLKNNCEISVLYIKPDVSFLSEIKTLQDNLIFNVLQEYARSAVFEKIYLVDNENLSDIVGDVPIREYYNHLNSLVVSTFHMINIFNHSEPVLNNYSKIVDTARILTLGLIDYKNDEEKIFFNLGALREKRYYYALPEEKIETDKKLMKDIRKQLKNKIKHDKMNVSYGIYQTNYEQEYVYCISYSSTVQNMLDN